MNVGHSDYLSVIYESPKKYKALVEKVAAELLRLKKKRKISFQAIAFSGTSGAAMAFPLAMYLGVSLVCVRRRGEKSHGQKIEGPWRDIKKYIIVDDFACSCNTINSIINGLNEYACWDRENPAQCAGIVFYNDPEKGSCGGRSFYIHNDNKIPLFRINKK